MIRIKDDFMTGDQKDVEKVPTALTEPMAITGSTVQNFVNSTIKQIQGAVPQGFQVRGDIAFDLSLVHKDEGGGKVDLKVIGLGGQVSKEQTQRVQFNISPIDEAAEADKKARIAKAQKEEEREKRNLKALQEDDESRSGEVSGVRYKHTSKELFR